MLNYRSPQPLVDPEIDLTSAEYSRWSHNAWILPQTAKANERIRR